MIHQTQIQRARKIWRSCSEIRLTIIPILYAKFGFADCEKGIIQAGVSFQPHFFSLGYQGDSALILPMVDMVTKLIFRD